MRLKNVTKRLSALIMSIVLLAGMIPETGVYAAEDVYEEVTGENVVSEDSVEAAAGEVTAETEIAESEDAAAPADEDTAVAEDTVNDEASEDADNVVNYNLWICNTQVTSSNMDDILGHGEVSYEPDLNNVTSGTLYINKNIEGSYNSATKTLIKSSLSNLNIYGGDGVSWPHLATTGTTKNQYIIDSTEEYGEITIGGKLAMSGFSIAAIRTQGSVTINGNVSITGEANSRAIYDISSSKKSVRINADGKLKFYGKSTSAIIETGIVHVYGDLEIENGSATAIYAPLYGMNVYSAGSVKISNAEDSNLEINSNSKAINLGSSTLTVEGSLEISGKYGEGVYAEGIEVSNGGVSIALPADQVAIDVNTVPNFHGLSILTPVGGTTAQATIKGESNRYTVKNNSTIANEVLIGEDCELTVGDKKITGSNKNNIPNVEYGTAHYDSGEGILYVIPDDPDDSVVVSSIKSDGNLKIVCEGSMITSDLDCKGSLTLTGSFTIKNSDSKTKDPHMRALYAKGRISLKNARVGVNGNVASIDGSLNRNILELDETSVLCITTYGAIDADIYNEGRIEVTGVGNTKDTITSNSMKENEYAGIYANGIKLYDSGSIYLRLRKDNTSAELTPLYTGLIQNGSGTNVTSSVKFAKPENGVFYTPDSTKIPSYVVTKGTLTKATEVEIAVQQEAIDKPIAVKFDMQGYGDEVDTQRLKEWEKVVKPDDPESIGQVFTGWYTEASCTTLYDFDTQVGRSFTLYAGWESDPKTVTFDMGGHGTQVAPQMVKEGGYATRPTDPEAAGYIFKGWYTTAQRNYPFYFSTQKINDNTTIYADWKTDKYQLRVGNRIVDDTNYKNIFGDDGSAVYDPATATLTFKDADIDGVSGKNRYMIWTGKDLTIKGNAKLKMDGAYYGIAAKAGTTLKLDADLDIEVRNFGIDADKLEIVGGKIKAVATRTGDQYSSVGIRSGSGLIISGGEVYAKGDWAGIISQDSGKDLVVKISGGTIEAEGSRYGAYVRKAKDVTGIEDNMMISIPENAGFKKFIYYAIGDGDGNIAEKVKIEPKPAPAVLTAISVPAKLTIKTGAKVTVSVNYVPENAADKSLEWKSSDPEVASVDDKGVVTGVKAGTATITVTAKTGGAKAECVIEVTPEQEGDNAEKTAISPDDLKDYAIPKPDSKAVEAKEINIGTKKAPKNVNVTVSMNYLDAVTYTGKAATPANDPDGFKFSISLNSIMDVAGVSGVKAEDLFKLTYVGKSKDAGKDRSFYVKVSLVPKARSKTGISKDQEKALKKILKVVNKNLKNNPVKFTINKVSITALSPEVHAKLKNDKINVVDGKLKGLKNVKVKFANATKLTKLNKKMYEVTEPNQEKNTVKLSGKGNFTGWITVTVTK